MTRRWLCLPLALTALLTLGACAGAWLHPPQPGAALSEVRQRLGAPTAEHPLPDGGRRLEYASGPFGKHTWMADFDAEGRLRTFEDVLTEAQFARVEAGTTQEQLRKQLGQPSRVWAVRYHGQTVWSYRYFNSACLLFHVGITPQGIVEDTSYGPDPLCERRNTDPGAP